MKQPRRSIWVVEFRFVGNTDWDYCVPLRAFFRKEFADEAARKRHKKFPTAEYRAIRYAAQTK